MLELSVYSASIVLLFLYLLIFKSTLNLTSLFLVLFLFMYGPAYVIYHWADCDKEHVKILSILMTMAVVMFITGQLLYVWLFGKRKSNRLDFNYWVESERKIIFINDLLLVFLSILFSIFIIVGLFFFGGLDSLLYVIRNPVTPEDFGFYRANTGVQGWISGFYNYAITGTGRFIGFLFLAIALYKGNILRIWFGVGYLLLIFVGLLANLSKSSALIFVFQILLFYFVTKGRKLNFRKSFIVALFSVFVLIGIYLLTTNAEDSFTAMTLVSNRIFNEPNRVLALYTEHYPAIYPHTYGMNIRLVHNLLSDSEFVSSDMLLAGNIQGATVNSIFVGDAWVDFSYIGVVFQALFLGVYLNFLDNLVFRNNNLISQTVFVALFLAVLSLISIPLLPSMITFGLLSVPIASFVLRIRVFYKK